MIFDCGLVTELVLKWQDEKDTATLGEILERTRPLIEAIVSTFDPDFRDDLIQESFVRVHYSLDSFDREISNNLYSFFVTVIRNVCITYMSKQGRDIPSDLDFIVEIEQPDIRLQDIMSDTITRNRVRFPSIPVSEMDDITEIIVIALSYGDRKPSYLVPELMAAFDITRPVATAIYHSTLIYLRWKYRLNMSKCMETVTDEFSVNRDLEELIGHDTFSKIAYMFSGMYIHIQ